VVGGEFHEKTRNYPAFPGFKKMANASLTPSQERFRVNAKIRQKLANRKRRIDRRLNKTKLGACSQPQFTASNIHYEIADRTRGLAHGGIGAIHVLARQIGLIDAIDERWHLLKFHLPFHESDHVLNFVYDQSRDVDIPIRRGVPSNLAERVVSYSDDKIVPQCCSWAEQSVEGAPSENNRRQTAARETFACLRPRETP
jgi:hypothetical protein